MKTITIKIPKNFMNTAITKDNYFIADTNDSKNWNTIKFPLPKGKWIINNKRVNEIILIKKNFIYYLMNFLIKLKEVYLMKNKF